MLIPDVSILVYAYNSDSPRHMKARKWWEQTLNGPRPVGLPWAVILGFVRIMTHRKIMNAPMFPQQATRCVQAWLTMPEVQILTPGEGHADVLFGLLDRLGTAGNLTTDAHLATLAIEYQAELASTDADFARFPGLRWFDPTK